MNQKLKTLFMIEQPFILVKTEEQKLFLEEVVELGNFLKYDKIISLDYATGLYDLKNNENLNNKDGSKYNRLEKQEVSFESSLINIFSQKKSIFVIKNFNFYINELRADNLKTVQIILNESNKIQNSIYIFMGSDDIICDELKPIFEVINYELQEEQILKIFKKFKEKSNIELSETEELEILKTLNGLNSYEVRNALLESLSRFQKLSIKTIREYKVKLFKEKYNITISYNSHLSMKNIIGYDRIYEVHVALLKKGVGKGTPIIGVSGTGKTYYAKCFSGEMNLPLVELNISELMNAYIGSTEKSTVKFIKNVEKVGPCILLLDEMEKILSGVKENSSNGDSGVGQRQGSILLQWLQDKPNYIFAIPTLNKINGIPAEYFRNDRFDSCWFVDLPSEEEASYLLDYYKEFYNLNASDNISVLGFTGADIKTLCRTAYALDCSLAKARTKMNPLYETFIEHIVDLRKYSFKRFQKVSSCDSIDLTTFFNFAE